MKRKIYIVVILLVLFIGLFGFYKYKQRAFLGLSEPQLETKQSILAYAKQHGLAGQVMVASDTHSQRVLSAYFSYGMIYVFKRDSTLLNCNIESLGGQCYQDIQNELCGGFPIEKRNFKEGFNGHKVLDTLGRHAQIISKILQNHDYQYIVLYSWVKYAKACIAPGSTEFLHCLRNNKDVLLISVNTDFIASP